MPLKELGLILFGSILGFGLSQIAELIRRHQERRKQREFGMQILKGIVNEVEEGVMRSEGLIEKIDRGQGSMSRIYVALWDSMKVELSKNIKDPEIVRLLHKIYYRFDLINFNMNRDRFGAGAGFAKEYISEMKANLTALKERIKDKEI